MYFQLIAPDGDFGSGVGNQVDVPSGGSAWSYYYWWFLEQNSNNALVLVWPSWDVLETQSYKKCKYFVGDQGQGDIFATSPLLWSLLFTITWLLFLFFLYIILLS